MSAAVLRPLGPAGTVLCIDDEEHRIVDYSCRGAYVRLERALGWEVTVAVEYVRRHQTPTASWRFEDKECPYCGVAVGDDEDYYKCSDDVGHRWREHTACADEADAAK